MTKQETAKILAYLYADNDKEMPEMKVLAWHDQLQHVSIEDGWRAARYLMRINTYGPPKFSDFNEALHRAGASSRWEPSAHEAWDLALQTARRCGVTKRREANLSLNHSLRVKRAIRRVTYERICMTETDKLGFVMRDFIEAYNADADAIEERRNVKELSESEAKVVKLVGNGGIKQ